IRTAASAPRSHRRGVWTILEWHPLELTQPRLRRRQRNSFFKRQILFESTAGAVGDIAVFRPRMHRCLVVGTTLVWDTDGLLCRVHLYLSSSHSREWRARHPGHGLRCDRGRRAVWLYTLDRRTDLAHCPVARGRLGDRVVVQVLEPSVSR